MPGEAEVPARARAADELGGLVHEVANARGLGITGGKVKQVDEGEAFLISFNCDVLVESVGLVAGNGQCGGFYRVGENGVTQDIYCLDAHIDSHDQSGLISDIGVLRAGQVLRLDSTPHHQNESPGRWRLATLTVRVFRGEAE